MTFFTSLNETINRPDYVPVLVVGYSLIIKWQIVLLKSNKNQSETLSSVIPDKRLNST